MAEDLHKQIKHDRETYRGKVRRPEDIQKFRDYAEGNHVLVLTEKQRKLLLKLTQNEFCDNICDQIISQARDRVIFKGWDSVHVEVKAFLKNLFVLNSIEGMAGEVAYDTFRDGSHVLALGWSNERQRVEIFQEPWWDGKCGAFVAYDSSNRPVYGVKDWYDREDQQSSDQANTHVVRRNVWFPDRLERYISRDNGMSWEALIYPDDPNWPIPWVKADGSPLHIPYIHFSNAGRGKKRYPDSELDGGILGFNDQINNIQWQLCMIGELTGFPIYTATGIRKVTNTEGQQVDGLEVAAGQLWRSDDPNTKFGMIEPGSVEEALRIYNQKVKSVARASRTPLHAITGGEWPSGEAIVRAEQPSVGKADNQVARFKVCWAEVAHRAIEIHNRFSVEGPQLPEDIETALVVALFDPTDRRDMLTRSVILNNVKDIYSQEESLRFLGHDDDKVKQIVQETREAKLFALRLAAAEASLRSPQPSGEEPEPNGTRSQRSTQRNMTQENLMLTDGDIPTSSVR